MINKFLIALSGAAMLILSAGCGSFAPADYNMLFQKTVQQAGDRVFPALVYIKVVQDNLGSGRRSSSSSSGSGVLISADGEVVTNNHVIDKAVSIRCLLNDGRAFDARLIGCDKDTDLA
ncbi:MAG: trypsin-like peptidase domain-containing protein, partial [Lentisphaeria bacterium]|nr:trypsin-like peptidase domain-containing protein [Lentisphaeria bacterium]